MVEETNGKWRVDHKVPITLIIAVAIQAAGIVYWGSQLDTRVSNMDHRVDKLEKIADKATDNDKEISSRLTALETTIVGLKDDSKDMKNALSRIESILISFGKTVK